MQTPTLIERDFSIALIEEITAEEVYWDVPIALQKYFILEFTASLENTGAYEASLTTWNAANLLSNISFFAANFGKN